MSVCTNCCNYNWTQPEDKSCIKRCSRCKFTSYCSIMCQKEHWVKVHKQHCKYLAKEEVLPFSRHVRANCLGCKQETDETPGPEDKSSPNLGCHMTEPVNYEPVIGTGGIRYSLPFELGEMSGHFASKVEATVSLMQRIMNKIVLTFHPVAMMCFEDSGNIARVLQLDVRQMFFNLYSLFNPGYMVRLKIGDELGSSYLRKIGNSIDIIDFKLSMAEFTEENDFKPWETFKNLFHLLDIFILDNMRKKVEAVGLPEMSSDIQSMMMATSAQFNDMWQDVLDSMSGNKLIPYTTLVKILSGGNFEQKCSGCFKHIIVSRVEYLDMNLTPQTSSCKIAHCLLTSCDTFLCGQPECARKVRDNLEVAINAFVRIGLEVTESLCNSCGEASRKLIMCEKCLTKQYCGVECKQVDWDKVHKEVCMELQVGRKRKVGK